MSVSARSPLFACEESRSLDLAGVTKRYGKFTALDGVDLAVKPGEIVGILGPNGAGKSTLLRICEGLERIDEGRVLLLGADLSLEPSRVKGRVGVVLQRPRFSGYATVGEVIALFGQLKSATAIAGQLVDALGLRGRMNTRVSKLSGGERQRLGVLVGLMGNEDILLLDEPTSELDPQARRVVWRLITETARKRGAAILMTTHQMEEAEYLCDRVYVLDNGRIVTSGAPAQVIVEHCKTLTVAILVHDTLRGTLLQKLPDMRWGLHGTYVKCKVTVDTVEAGQKLMLSLLAQFGDQILEIGLERPNLEDVFIGLTGSALRK